MYISSHSPLPKFQPSHHVTAFLSYELQFQKLWRLVPHYLKLTCINREWRESTPQTCQGWRVIFQQMFLIFKIYFSKLLSTNILLIFAFVALFPEGIPSDIPATPIASRHRAPVYPLTGWWQDPSVSPAILL